ncbi:CLUMA_CG020409, isoform A [Clunio marinus]|uniref:CLUMA_CG020409, isoform A n=1 Tax=Clunio marinus TaxID=568069 RepID=A0A1J1J621_9DIPT|nr:CLUMA_CG020409, isoform A [Clunio marinus]
MSHMKKSLMRSQLDDFGEQQKDFAKQIADLKTDLNKTVQLKFDSVFAKLIVSKRRLKTLQPKLQSDVKSLQNNKFEKDLNRKIHFKIKNDINN